MSSSGKRPVILAKWKCRRAASRFCSQWRPPRPKRRNCKQVWGSSHILLSLPFLTYTFQSWPPTQRWSERARPSSPCAPRRSTAKLIPARPSDGRRSEFFMKWNSRLHENRLVSRESGRTGSLFSAGGKRNRAARVGLSSANVSSDDGKVGRLEITQHTSAHTQKHTDKAQGPPLVL